MAAINSLLNPLLETITYSGSEAEMSSKRDHDSRTDDSSSSQVRKKQKVVKDAAIFVRGPVRGECRYPPHEFQDDLLAAMHQQFEVYPMGEIADYPRHIPYSSEKKSFLKTTGRESLEVFQYQFKIPGEETTYSVLWDYNIGLVRTTPLFKCTGHSKTTPAKMLNRNVGLRDICHSITGGALVAQGYWMPYDAAKAVAATFCWNIRYALTPVFGIDFPDLCLPPTADKYGDMLIDPEITQFCANQTRIYRGLEQPVSRSTTTTPSPATPTTPKSPRTAKQFLPKRPKFPASSGLVSSASDNSSVSPSNTPTPSEASYINFWTPSNTPRSVPLSLSSPLSPRTVFRETRFSHFSNRHARPRSPTLASNDESDSETTDSSPPVSPKTKIEVGEGSRSKIRSNKSTCKSKKETRQTKEAVGPQSGIKTANTELINGRGLIKSKQPTTRNEHVRRDREEENTDTIKAARILVDMKLHGSNGIASEIDSTTPGETASNATQTRQARKRRASA